jgi:hypothetical protein
MWLLDWRGAPETHMPLGKKKRSRRYPGLDSRGREEQLSGRGIPVLLAAAN